MRNYGEDGDETVLSCLYGCCFLTSLYVVFWAFWDTVVCFFTSNDDDCQETKHAVTLFLVILPVSLVAMIVGLRKRECSKYFLIAMVLVGFSLFEIYIISSNPNPYSEKC